MANTFLVCKVIDSYDLESGLTFTFNTAATLPAGLTAGIDSTGIRTENAPGVLIENNVVAVHRPAASRPAARSLPFNDSNDDGAMDLFELLGGDRNGDGIDSISQRNVATHLSIPASGNPQFVTLVSALAPRCNNRRSSPLTCRPLQA